MIQLLFISRVAFICNLCMLAAWLMRYAKPLQDTAVQSTIVIAGFLLAVICNVIVTFWLLIRLFQGKDIPRPLWLFIINFICFVFQIYLFVK